MPTYQFNTHIETLANQVRLQGDAASVPGVLRRAWNIPAFYPVGIDVQHPFGFGAACSRSELNAMVIASYETGVETNAGRLGIVGAGKKAIDYQAGYERALHARHASAMRRRVWAMARRTGHSDLRFGVYAAVRTELDAMVSAASATDNSPRN